jgi:hypothetical protein
MTAAANQAAANVNTAEPTGAPKGQPATSVDRRPRMPFGAALEADELESKHRPSGLVYPPCGWPAAHVVVLAKHFLCDSSTAT